MRLARRVALVALATATALGPMTAAAQRAKERKTVAILPFTSPTRWSAMGRTARRGITPGS